jgi:hypothetical protein
MSESCKSSLRSLKHCYLLKWCSLTSSIWSAMLENSLLSPTRYITTIITRTARLRCQDMARTSHYARGLWYGHHTKATPYFVFCSPSRPQLSLLPNLRNLMLPLNFTFLMEPRSDSTRMPSVEVKRSKNHFLRNIFHSFPNLQKISVISDSNELMDELQELKRSALMNCTMKSIFVTSMIIISRGTGG